MLTGSENCQTFYGDKEIGTIKLQSCELFRLFFRSRQQMRGGLWVVLRMLYSRRHGGGGQLKLREETKWHFKESSTQIIMKPQEA